VAHEGKNVKLSLVDQDPNPGLKKTYQTLLQASLEESKTYRKYFRRGDLGNYLSHGKTS